MKKNLILICVFSTLLFACKKSGSDPQTAALTCLNTAVKQGSITYVSNTYNSSRQVSKTLMYDNKGVLMTEDNYEYSNGLKSKVTTIDHTASPAATTFATYEYSGTKISKENSYDDRSVLSSYVVYTYGSDGKLSKTQDYSLNNGSFTSNGYTTYEYNSTGTIKSVTSHDIKSGSSQNAGNYTYDNNGNLTSVSSTDSTGTHKQAEFEYDTTKPNYFGSSLNNFYPFPYDITPANALTKYTAFNTGSSSVGYTFQYSNFSNGYPGVVNVTPTAGTSGNVTSSYFLEYDCK